jgi:hypothetical protein
MRRPRRNVATDSGTLTMNNLLGPSFWTVRRCEEPSAVLQYARLASAGGAGG